MNVALIMIISVVYSLSSYIGIQKGMAVISNYNTKSAIVFCIVIVVLGPGLFSFENTTNSLGLMLQNFIQMSLYTDSVAYGRFSQSWTIFYWLYWVAYALFTEIFIGASLNTIKTCGIITGIPVMFIILVMVCGWLKWMKDDNESSHELDL